jgi:hypothetical protein
MIDNTKIVSAIFYEHALAAILAVSVLTGINYFADLRMTFCQNFFLQDWFRNKFVVGLG